MPAISKDTTLCISIAERPSNGGTALFNFLFGHFGMDWVYKACQVGPSELEGAIAGVRALKIRGCGVSMPHKGAVMEYLDSIDDSSRKIGAVNTILNENGKLTGFNTDSVGAAMALDGLYDMHGKRALLFGAGGMARASIVALKKCGAKEILIYNRTDGKAEEIAAELGCRAIKQGELDSVEAELFFNATPVGMDPQPDAMPFEEAYLARFEAVADAVAMPRTTRLISAAKKLGKVAIPGYVMASYQSSAQFKIYTGREAPIELVRKKMMEGQPPPA